MLGTRSVVSWTLSFVFLNENQTKSILVYIICIYFSEFGFSPSALSGVREGVRNAAFKN